MADKKRPVLTYFKGRGKAEMARLACVAAGVEYDEVFVQSREEYLQLVKDDKLLYKQLPMFEIDGLRLVGSDSIVRYLARKHDLYGKTNEEKARIDIFMMGAKDFFDTTLSGYLCDPEPPKVVKERILPIAKDRYLPAFEKSLSHSGTGFLVGSGLTLADILVFDCLTHITESPIPTLVAVLDNYPKCKAFMSHIGSQPRIKEYLASPKRYPVPTHELVETVKKILGMTT